MKNKKGFTLIELLAVIVVLAIIALIATPIVMNTIKNAKKGAAERTADNYIKQVETAVAEAKLGNNSIPNGTYDIDGNGNLTGTGLPDGKLEINMSGNKPTSGTVTISNGGVSQDGTKLVVGDYNVKYNQENHKYQASEKSNIVIVYRNSTDKIKIGDIIDINDTSKFTMNSSTLGKTYYLKHEIEGNKVSKSYVCSKLDEKEYCLTNGKYGYDENDENYTDNLLILKEYQADGLNCSFNEQDSRCIVESNFLYARSSGGVDVNHAPGRCDVTYEGISYCDGL